MTKFWKAGLLASTSALTLLAATPQADAQGMNWTGFYTGVGLGWDFNFGDVTGGAVGSGFYEPQKSMSASGVSGSIFGGYRYQIAGTNIVVGAEVKLSMSSASDRSTQSDDCNIVCRDVTLRSSFGINAGLTAGMVLQNGILPFVKVGYAGKRLKVSGQGSSVGTTFNQSKWLNGIELGAGVDIPIGAIGGAVNLPAAIRIEGSYTFLGKKKFESRDGQGGTASDQLRVNPDAANFGVSLMVKF